MKIKHVSYSGGNMQQNNINEILNETLTEVAKFYINIDKYDLEDILCKTLSEVLSEYYGFKIVAHIDDHNRLSLTKHASHQGDEYVTNMDVSNVKEKHIRETVSRLQYILDLHDAQESVIKNSFGMLNVAKGKVQSYNKITDTYTILLDGTYILGYCKQMDLPIGERRTIATSHCYFYTKYIKIETIENKLRPIIHLSRNAKRFPAALIKSFSDNKQIKLKTLRRNAGKLTIIECNTAIKKEVIAQVSSELNGEYIKLVKSTGGAS